MRGIAHDTSNHAGLAYQLAYKLTIGLIATVSNFTASPDSMLLPASFGKRRQLTVIPILSAFHQSEPWLLSLLSSRCKIECP
jgi:hypothetical protein